MYISGYIFMAWFYNSCPYCKFVVGEKCRNVYITYGLDSSEIVQKCGSICITSLVLTDQERCAGYHFTGYRI